MTLSAGTGDEQVIRWNVDGHSVLMFNRSEVPAALQRVDVSTGKRELVGRVGQLDPTGVLNVREVVLSADGKAHAYTIRRMLSRLFLVQGAR